MKFSIRFADKIVGTLVILALAVLLVVIFMVGSNLRWFAKDYQYVTYFESASGLSTNMPVQYRGFTIGHVKKFTLTEDDSVEVIFTIFEEHNDRVREGSVVELQASPIGLGNSFLFHPGRGTDKIPEGSMIPEINSPQARLLARMGLVNKLDSTDSINNIFNQAIAVLAVVDAALTGEGGENDPILEQIIKNIDDVVKMLQTQLSPIMAQLSPIMAQLNPIMDNLETVTTQMSAPSGTVMSILDSEGPIVTDLSTALNSLAGIVENLERTSDFVPAQLPQIAVLIADLNVMLRSAQDVLTAIANNPLLRGGIPQRVESGPGGASHRNLEF
jgi:phospholipid/cholesterol/gamma-HCH transport system substrate-binding protein